MNDNYNRTDKKVNVRNMYECIIQNVLHLHDKKFSSSLSEQWHGNRIYVETECKSVCIVITEMIVPSYWSLLLKY